VKSQQLGPTKSEWNKLEASNSMLKPCCQASHYSQHQKITMKGTGWSRLPQTS
jgi:hypothetical protein